jgi:ABC-2 type transport system permease protein
MGNTLTIFRREMSAYFNSPVGYIVIAMFLLVSGYLLFFHGGGVFLAGEASLRGFFGWTPFIFIFFTPAITMRLLAEERRSGTLELLITMPVTDWQVVLGKFLAAVGLWTLAILLTLAYPITLSRLGDLDWGAVAGGYIGLVLMGAAYLAIGLMASSWTRNQVVAFIVALGITLALYLCGQTLPVVPPALVPLLEYISLDYHFANISKGVVDTRDLIYYASLIGGCLFLAKQSLESRRWR